MCRNLSSVVDKFRKLPISLASEEATKKIVDPIWLLHDYVTLTNFTVTCVNEQQMSRSLCVQECQKETKSYLDLIST